VNDLWQQRWNEDAAMRADNLANEKSHRVIRLTPRSLRTEYGLRLTNRLIREIARSSADHGAKFMAFARDAPEYRALGEPSSGETVFRLNGKYYRTSNRQYLENLEEMNHGVAHCLIPVAVEDWRVSREDGHLNPQALDRLMLDLAARVAPLVR
jgi:hypothetical protein